MFRISSFHNHNVVVAIYLFFPLFLLILWSAAYSFVLEKDITNYFKL